MYDLDPCDVNLTGLAELHDEMSLFLSDCNTEACLMHLREHHWLSWEEVCLVRLSLPVPQAVYASIQQTAVLMAALFCAGCELGLFCPKAVQPSASNVYKTKLKLHGRW